MLPAILRPHEFVNRNDFIDRAEEIFLDLVINRQNRETLNNKFIYVDEVEQVDDKLDIFWHVVGLEENAELTIYPCSNDPILLLCNKNCETREWVVRTKNKEKAVCLYRAARMSWIKGILSLANSKDSRIKIWVDRERTFIRYNYEMDDFVIILEPMRNNRNMYKFVTAYPVFFRSQQRDFDRKYQLYIKQQQKSIKK